MLKTTIASFVLAFTNIRSHFFHTVLSVLGIVIGVASLVAILSLIDGMEQYARDQISNTTSLKMITINTNAFRNSDGISVRKDSVTILKYADFRALEESLTLPAKAMMYLRHAREVGLSGDTVRVGAHTTAIAGLDTASKMVDGRRFTDSEIEGGGQVCILNRPFAKKLAGTGSASALLHRFVTFSGRTMEVVGVIDLKQAQGPELFYPFTVLSVAEISAALPGCFVEAEKVEDVPALKEEVIRFLDRRFAGGHDFRVVTNELRVEQAAQGFFLFRVIMGLIVGISVIVGGIGVMNVLLISVTERTAEIGVRKAVGANKRDIILQFLSESITISMFGSFIGLVLGVLGTMIVVPVIRSLTKIPFQAAYTWNTLIVVSVLAVIIGVVFGTYPALRAARLDPVEAIRRE